MKKAFAVYMYIYITLFCQLDDTSRIDNKKLARERERERERERAIENEVMCDSEYAPYIKRIYLPPGV